MRESGASRLLSRVETVLTGPIGVLTGPIRVLTEAIRVLTKAILK